MFSSAFEGKLYFLAHLQKKSSNVLVHSKLKKKLPLFLDILYCMNKEQSYLTAVQKQSVATTT